MLTAQDIVLQYVCPGLGAGIAFFLFLSPMPAVRRVNSTKQLGDVNVLPFAMMAVNCASWVLYSFLITDYFIYCGNIPGLILGLYYTFICYKYSKESAQDTLNYLLLGCTLLIWTIGLFNLAVIKTPAAARTLWGALCVSVLGLYYSAPLTTLYRVVTTRNSSSLYWPLCLMNIINGALWFAYGLAIKDWFVCVPNGVGAAFNVVCIVMCIIFPRSTPGSDGSSSSSSTSAHIGRNWSLLRLQSKRSPAATPAVTAVAVMGDTEQLADKPGAAEHPPVVPVRADGRRHAAGHSFLDVSQMRWRAGEAALPTAGAPAAAPAHQQQQPGQPQSMQVRLQGVDTV